MNGGLVTNRARQVKSPEIDLARTISKSNETRTIDGVEHFVIRLDISAFSHPFYTGQKRIVDSAGRVEKFMQRYGRDRAKK